MQPAIRQHQIWELVLELLLSLRRNLRSGNELSVC